MGDVGKIVSITLGENSALFLAEDGRYTLLDRLMSKKGGNQDRARRIAIAAERVARGGVQWALQSKTLKPLHGLDSDLAICELRIKGHVIRVMTYLHDDKGRTPVYLFDFDGHQGKTGSIPKGTLERAEKLARIACACMKRVEEEQQWE